MLNHPLRKLLPQLDMMRINISLSSEETMQTSEQKVPILFYRRLNRILLLTIALTLTILVILILPGEKTMFAGKRPTHLGVQSGQLAPCPNTPNCVSSFSLNAQHRIEPLSYRTTASEAMAALKQVIQSLDRTKIVTETDNYLYVEFKSALMGFVDDVEFLLDEGKKVIQVRSASRLGQSDLGVNRNRIETIRSKLSQA